MGASREGHCAECPFYAPAFRAWQRAAVSGYVSVEGHFLTLNQRFKGQYVTL
jgi:hypothetical protein